MPKPTRAFALLEHGAKGMRLAAINRQARSLGLVQGQPLADARAAVPDLLTAAHDPEVDKTSLLGLCHWMERYSPWVSPDGIDGILLNITGIAHLFGGEEAMMTVIGERLQGYGFTSRLACAETIGAAWAHARYGGKPGPETHILPVEALRIDAASAQTLRRLGLKTIGALTQLPRGVLASRFRGEVIQEHVQRRLDQLLGFSDEPLTPVHPPAVFLAHRALMHPVISHEGLTTLLWRMTQDLCIDLVEKGQGALRLVLRLFRSDGGRLDVPAGLSAPSHDAAHIFRLLEPKLHGHDVGLGIDALTLEARETAHAETRQYGFMEEAHDKGLAELNDRILNRQERSLANLAPVASHIPERAERETSLPGALPVKSQAQAAGRSTAMPRPHLLFDRPEPAAVIATVPDGLPAVLVWRRVKRKLVKVQGPERIAPEWWRREPRARLRDYYMVEDERGRRYWIYCEGFYGDEEGPPPKWFVHGLSG